MSVVDEVVAKFSHAGWTITKKESVAGGRGANPTRIDLQRGKHRRALLVYAWKITGEGKGRSGTNYRIQTTRSHEGDLLIEGGRLTLGFGFDTERDVIAVFDGWTKRATGASSSVHIQRATLDKAAAEGYAEEPPRWDSRAAALASDIEQLLTWMSTMQRTRTAAVQPLEHAVHGDTATITADLWDSAPAAWLRVGDRLVLASRDGKSLLDTAIWAVDSLQVTVTRPGRNPRRSVSFTCHRYGRVKRNPADLLQGLSGRPAHD